MTTVYCIRSRIPEYCDRILMPMIGNKTRSFRKTILLQFRILAGLYPTSIVRGVPSPSCVSCDAEQLTLHTIESRCQSNSSSPLDCVMWHSNGVCFVSFELQNWIDRRETKMRAWVGEHVLIGIQLSVDGTCDSFIFCKHARVFGERYPTHCRSTHSYLHRHILDILVDSGPCRVVSKPNSGERNKK